MAQVELLVAADLYGQKVNIKFVFPARPTLKEFTTQIELAFRKEAVLQRAGLDSVQNFDVSSLQVYSDSSGMWTDVVRQGQLLDGSQYYAFQKRTTRGRSGSRGRLRSRSPSTGRTFSNGRRTSISNRQSHYADERSRMTGDSHAERTATNDRRYSIFKELAPEGRLYHSRVPNMLISKGAAPIDVEEIQCALSAMEIGADKMSSSFAQFSRFLKHNPETAGQLYKILGGEWGGIGIKAESPRGAVNPPPVMCGISDISHGLPQPQVPIMDKNDSWLQSEMRKLEEEHQVRVMEVKMKYSQMEQDHLQGHYVAPPGAVYYESGATPRKLPITSPPPPPPRSGRELNTLEEAELTNVYSQLGQSLNTAALYSPPTM